MANNQRKKKDMAIENRRKAEDKNLSNNRNRNDALTQERRFESDLTLRKNRERNDEMTSYKRKVKNGNSGMYVAITMLVLIALGIGTYFLFI